MTEKALPNPIEVAGNKTHPLLNALFVHSPLLLGVCALAGTYFVPLPTGEFRRSVGNPVQAPICRITRTDVYLTSSLLCLLNMDCVGCWCV